jgi:hypothetical protein
MRVFLHTRDPEENEGVNDFRGFARIPVVGDYVALPDDPRYFKVVLVVHTPFPCDCEAEVYAVKDKENATEVIVASGYKSIG